MKLIGIAGADGSGKTTLAESLREIYGDKGKSVHVNFADKLKDEVAHLLWASNTTGKTKTLDEWKEFVRQKPTPEWLRLLFRGWGNYRRSVDPDYWVRKWVSEVVDHKYLCDFKWKQEAFVVCSDVRYANEAKAIHELGGTVLFLDDISKPLEKLSEGERHELHKVADMCDHGFLMGSRKDVWVKPEYVFELLKL